MTVFFEICCATHGFASSFFWTEMFRVFWITGLCCEVGGLDAGAAGSGLLHPDTEEITVVIPSTIKTWRIPDIDSPWVGNRVEPQTSYSKGGFIYVAQARSVPSLVSRF